MQKQVVEWGNERDLIHEENAPKQLLKLTEEVGELAAAFIKKNKKNQEDAVGDIQIVLILFCKQVGIDYDKALYDAYHVIKNRKGKTENGTFIKEEDYTNCKTIDND
jgi:NTP pyrophosphatase (non-canonical NTP hydrolase)